VVRHLVDGLVRPFVPIDYPGGDVFAVRRAGSGLVVAFLALTLLGFSPPTLIGRKAGEHGRSLLGRMPVVRAILSRPQAGVRDAVLG